MFDTIATDRAEKRLRIRHLRPSRAMSRENIDLSNTFRTNDQLWKGDIILSIFHIALRCFPFQDASFIVEELRLAVLIAETFER